MRNSDSSPYANELAPFLPHPNSDRSCNSSQSSPTATFSSTSIHQGFEQFGPSGQSKSMGQSKNLDQSKNLGQSRQLEQSGSSCMSFSTKQALCRCLDVPTCQGNDWRKLAEVIG